MRFPRRTETLQEQVIPKPEETVARKKKISQENLKKRKLTAREYILREINANKSKFKKKAEKAKTKQKINKTYLFV